MSNMESILGARLCWGRRGVALGLRYREWGPWSGSEAVGPGRAASRRSRGRWLRWGRRAGPPRQRPGCGGRRKRVPFLPARGVGRPRRGLSRRVRVTPAGAAWGEQAGRNGRFGFPLQGEISQAELGARAVSALPGLHGGTARGRRCDLRCGIAPRDR